MFSTCSTHNVRHGVTDGDDGATGGLVVLWGWRWRRGDWGTVQSCGEEGLGGFEVIEGSTGE